jgi:hypothetical protein
MTSSGRISGNSQPRQGPMQSISFRYQQHQVVRDRSSDKLLGKGEVLRL